MRTIVTAALLALFLAPGCAHDPVKEQERTIANIEAQQQMGNPLRLVAAGYANALIQHSPKSTAADKAKMAHATYKIAHEYAIADGMRRTGATKFAMAFTFDAKVTFTCDDYVTPPQGCVR